MQNQPEIATLCERRQEVTERLRAIEGELATAPPGWESLLFERSTLQAARDTIDGKLRTAAPVRMAIARIGELINEALDTEAQLRALEIHVLPDATREALANFQATGDHHVEEDNRERYGKSRASGEGYMLKSLKQQYEALHELETLRAAGADKITPNMTGEQRSKHIRYLELEVEESQIHKNIEQLEASTRRRGCRT